MINIFLLNSFDELFELYATDILLLIFERYDGREVAFDDIGFFVGVVVPDQIVGQRGGVNELNVKLH